MRFVCLRETGLLHIRRITHLEVFSSENDFSPTLNYPFQHTDDLNIYILTTDSLAFFLKFDNFNFSSLVITRARISMQMHVFI